MKRGKAGRCEISALFVACTIVFRHGVPRSTLRPTNGQHTCWIKSVDCWGTCAVATQLGGNSSDGDVCARVANRYPVGAIKHAGRVNVQPDIDHWITSIAVSKRPPNQRSEFGPARRCSSWTSTPYERKCGGEQPGPFRRWRIGGLSVIIFYLESSC